jgi:flagellar hook-associated protein 2
VAGSYNVTVSSLASGQQLLSGAFDASTAIGTGTLGLSVGGQSFAVSITSANDTLSGIATAINGATSNTGITATVIQGTDGAHLLLSSANSGAANTITVSETDGGTALAALTYGSGNTSHFTQQTPAADASFSVAGVPYTSSSNSVSTAISGVTLNLAGLTAGAVGAPTDAPATVTVTVANDSSTVQKNIDSFVSAYNALQGTLAQLGSYDKSTGTAGQFLGNPVLTNIQSQIQRSLYSLVGSSNYNSLAGIGITTNSDGSLSVNDATLQNALSSNFSAVSQLFSSANGVAAKLNSNISTDLQSGGAISAYSQTLTSQENALTQQTSTLNNQMSALQASLTQQYATLNTLLSSLQSTSSYLTQAFASLPSVQGTPNA